MTGKQCLVEEVSQMVLSTAYHMLEFAQLSQDKVSPDNIEVSCKAPEAENEWMNLKRLAIKMM